MKNIITVLFLSSLLFGIPAMAGSGHEHDKDGGHSHVHKTINSEEAATIEQKSYKNGPEWVTTFKNDKISDVTKQTLYLFFSLDGHYIAANYTGN
ncbi:hypothetical protein MNBD_GAMMA17-1542 [hydrothermal vent metagenome]|uniref:Uncharacterized protein n=1 Tax=hydrothermal vent metagenome TaxID=652676 RepID=A0A3B0ZL31_9ZZZZ